MNGFSRMQGATVLLLSLLILFFYGWRLLSSTRQPSRSPSIAALDVVVQISGKVRHPGIYSFDGAVTLTEAVSHAGGLLSPLKPDPSWTKLLVAHARRVHVAAGRNGFARVQLEWMDVPHRLVLGVPLNVNLASAKELALVPGISQKLADRIVARRLSLGGFSRVEDLRLVHGIGPVTLERIRPCLEVGKVDGSAQQAVHEISGLEDSFIRGLR